jgi:hypothetical protein
MKKLIAILILTLTLAAVAQNPPDTTPKKYNIESAGKDVRDIVHKLFADAKKSYIMDPTIRKQLYINVYDLDFDAALNMLVEQAKLQVELRDGITYITPQPTAVATSHYDWTATMTRKVNLKREKIALRTAMNEIGRKIGVPIQVETGVPDYLINLSFTDVSLKYALDNVTKAAQLAYEQRQDGSIRIIRPSDEVTLDGAGTTVKSGMSCPNCKLSIEKGWKYCPNCGYWVKPITDKG